MASQWIDAASARSIVADGGSLSQAERTICERANARLLNARAKLFCVGDEEKRDCMIPADFWWAKGDLALEQDWKAGDFSTWLERKTELRAFGVEFAFDGILALLPAERRPIVARAHSVDGHTDWLNTRAARVQIGKTEGIYEKAAAGRLIELCRLGFVTARAVQMSRRRERRSETIVEREWDVPVWFWQHCVTSLDAKIDWTLGSFSGSHMVDGHRTRFDLIGVHFLRSALEPDIAKPEDAVDNTDEIVKPRLPNAKLDKWWQSKSLIRESLTIPELLAIARDQFPDNHVSRDRIRVLAAGRKRGPKPIGD